MGLNPSEGSGLADIVGDPDMNAAFKITDKDAQEVVVISKTAEGYALVQTFDLSGLTLETE